MSEQEILGISGTLYAYYFSEIFIRIFWIFPDIPVISDRVITQWHRTTRYDITSNLKISYLPTTR